PAPIRASTPTRLRGRGGPVTTTILFLAAALIALAGQPPSLDYDTFKTKVQPIFVAKRPGHARCISCHASGTPLRLQPLKPGATTWSEEDSRKNFEAVARVAAGSTRSMLLRHPLAESAGGDFFHSGGKHWETKKQPGREKLESMGNT